MEIVPDLPFDQGCFKGTLLGLVTFLDIAFILAQLFIVEECPLRTKNIRASRRRQFSFVCVFPPGYSILMFPAAIRVVFPPLAELPSLKVGWNNPRALVASSFRGLGGDSTDMAM